MTINAQQLAYILDNTPADQNIMLVGKHGIGKSRILEDYFASKNEKVVTLFLGQMADPADLLGLPEKNNKTGKTDFMVPYWFPTDGKPVVLFLDELNRSRPEILQVIMDLTLNRKLAGRSLPVGSRIISAVNNGNEYQLTDLDPALVSRFNIYTFNPTVEDWISWAQKSGIDQRIINFIGENPEFLDSENFEQDTDGLERLPDRRSWERTSKIIKNMPELGELQKALVSGVIGNRATVTFFRYVMEHNYPSAKEILEGDFNSVKPKMEKLTSIDFTQVNISLFRFIESGVYDQNKTGDIATNLIEYFDYLGEKALKEILSHFASLCSANDYPNTLCFISNLVPDLYQKLMNLVMEV